MKNFLIFIGGFVAGIIATFLILYLIAVACKPNDGLIGVTKFPEKGECITKAQKNKSCEIKILQVLAPNAVYLKSDAWQRKRYVVLKRDNWRCVYCGGRATQVHHKNTQNIKLKITKESS